MTAVVLASASPARLAVLRAAGLDPRVQVSGVDEHGLLAASRTATPAERVAVLADAKAAAVAAARPAADADTVVLGCDSMLEMDGDLLGKPGSAAVARERWRRMSGGTGVLHTGHAVLRLAGGRIAAREVATASTLVRFAELTGEQIDAYVATGEPLAVAGAFTLDGYGGWFVESVDGAPSNVIGISLPLLRRLLAAVGVRVTDLWRPPV